MSTLTPEQAQQQIQEALQRFPKIVQQTTLRLMLSAETKAKQYATSRLRVRSGSLRRSIQTHMVTLSGGAGSVEGRLQAGQGAPHARLQNDGGVIRPKRASWLRIPLRAALTGAGVDRHSGSLRTSGAGLFHVRKARNGKLYLFHKSGGPPWYALVKESKVPGTHYLSDAFRETAQRAPQELREMLAQALGRAQSSSDT